MAPVATYLLNYNVTNEKITRATLDLMFWSQKLDLNAAKLANAQKNEKTYSDAKDKALDVDRTKDLSCGCVTAHVKCGVDEAERYARAKAPKYDPDVLEELTEKDIEYETMKTLLETELEKWKAEKDAQKENLNAAAGDTGLMQG